MKTFRFDTFWVLLEFFCIMCYTILIVFYATLFAFHHSRMISCLKKITGFDKKVRPRKQFQQLLMLRFEKEWRSQGSTEIK